MSGEEPFGDDERLICETFSQRPESPEELFAMAYHELRQVARAYVRRERPGGSIESTMLVHEAYLRLFEGKPFLWENRKHLFCTVARTMRRILVDHARRNHAECHGGGHHKVTLDDQGPILYQDLPQALALDEALGRLAKLNPRRAQVVELHHFAGLTEEETAEVLDVAVKTIKNDWKFAKAWLRTEMGGEDDSGAPRPDRGDLPGVH